MVSKGVGGGNRKDGYEWVHSEMVRAVGKEADLAKMYNDIGQHDLALKHSLVAKSTAGRARVLLNAMDEYNRRRERATIRGVKVAFVLVVLIAIVLVIILGGYYG